MTRAKSVKINTTNVRLEEEMKIRKGLQGSIFSLYQRLRKLLQSIGQILEAEQSLEKKT